MCNLFYLTLQATTIPPSKRAQISCQWLQICADILGLPIHF